MERLPIGIPNLDQIILGGLPKGSLSVVIGPPGAGKGIFSKRFLFTGIQEGRDAFLVATTEGPDNVIETMRNFGWGGGIDERLRILDCYSSRYGRSGAKYSASVASLTDVSVMTSKMLDDFRTGPEGKARLVFDSFSDVIKYSGPERSLKFLDSLRSRLQLRGVTALVLLEEGVHDQSTVSAVEHSTDGTVRMRFSDAGRSIMVSRLTSTPLNPKWVPIAFGG